MQQFPGDPPRLSSTESARGVLEVFSTSAQIAFDRLLAARVLSEAERAIPGEDWSAWSGRLVEVGESLNLKIRAIESSLDEALIFVQQGVPVATCLERPDGGLRWILLAEARGRQVRVTTLGEEEPAAWMRLGALRKALRLPSRSARLRWVIGQPALSCSPPAPAADESGDSHHHPQHHPTPFARLLGLVRPEKNDLWVILLFSVTVGVLALASPIAVEALVNTVAFGRYLQPILILALILFTFLAFAAAMRGLLAYIVEILQRRMLIRVVEDLAYRLPRARHNAFDATYGPELANRFFDVVTLQKAISSLLLDGIAIVLQTVIGMAVLAFYHPFLLGFDVVLLTLIAIIIFGLGRGAVATAQDESKAKYAIAAWLEELTRHPTAFKLHAGTQFALDRADQLAIDWLDARRAHFRILMRQILFSLGLQALAATALLGMGGWLVIMGELTLGQLVAAELIVMIIVGSFAKFGKHLENFYDLLASVDKLGYLFDLPTEARDKMFHLRDGSPASINLCDVDYHFGSQRVLQGFDLTLEPAEKVALVGAPGTGKSTLIELCCGMRQPSSGHLELDGIDLRELRPDSLREHLAVARGTEIFAGSIDENVHLHRPHISALDVREALNSVGLLEELLHLPDGLNTPLLTGGAPLSANQATRLMLARAIVGRPRLLLIDGTLDGLPDDALAPVLAHLTSPQAPWTLLVSTGRSAVTAACDRVVSLSRVRGKRGRKLETPADLND